MTHVVCDLDGVLFRGKSPIEGAAEALIRLIDSGVRVTYVTNNSTRSPQNAARNIESIIGVQTDPAQIVTSSMAAASVLTTGDWPALPVGEEGVTSALRDAGVPITEDPGKANSVVVGMDQSVTYEVIADAAEVVRRGARFVATNTDATYPTATRLLPGAGALVAAIATAGGRAPEIAGKPHRPMQLLLTERGIERAWVVGDRLETDIALADGQEGWRSILVLTGVTSREEGVGNADHVVEDFPAAVDVVLSTPTRR